MPKILFALTTIGVSFFVNLARGSKSMESIFGVKKCSSEDWLILAAYFIFSAVMTYLAIRIVKSEQSLKNRVGRGMVNSDIKFEG